MAPTLSSSRSVGEGGIKGDRMWEAVAICCYPSESVGDVGGRKEEDKDYQGQVASTACVAKNRQSDAEKSAGWFVINYLSNVKQLPKEMLTSQPWEHVSFFIPDISICSHHNDESHFLNMT